MGLSGEREIVVHKEIPDRYRTDGEQLREVEIHAHPVGEQVDNPVVDPESHDGDTQEGEVLLGDGWVVVGERPDAVEDVVRRGSTYEPCRVRDILVDPGFLFEQVGDSEIDSYAAAPDYAKFDEFGYHRRSQVDLSCWLTRAFIVTTGSRTETSQDKRIRRKAKLQ